MAIKQVVPDPEELEDGEGGKRRKGQRQDDAGKDFEIASAIDAGGFDDFLGQAGDVVAQEIDRQRQAEGGMRQPDAGIGLGWHAKERADLIIDPQKRDQRHLQRHDDQPDDGRQKQRAALKFIQDSA